MVQFGHYRTFTLRSSRLTLVQQFTLTLNLERVRDFPSEWGYYPYASKCTSAEQTMEFQIIQRINRLIFILAALAFVILFSSTSKPMQVLNHTLNVGQRQSSQYDLVGDDIDRLLAVLVPTLPTPKPHISIRRQRILSKEPPALNDAIRSRMLLRNHLYATTPDNIQCRLVNTIPLDEYFLVNTKTYIFNQCRQQFVFKVFDVCIMK
mmetsp:Transcript_7927/g.17863  ORF Transcript_7927/g.17863 Transcript_7927/m.17863 type:complete len:207 (+) Transcript_7927:204-824(+)